MPEPTQLTFTHQELLELLVRAAGLKTGKWMLLVNFGFSAANIGPDAASVMPSAIVGVQNVGLARAPDDAPASLVVDAALLG